MLALTTTIPQLPAPAASRVGVDQLLEAFLSGRSPNTIRTYRQGLEHFACWLGVLTVGAAANRLLTIHHGEANLLAMNYKARMVEDGVAANTINSRLTAVRALTSLARRLGIIAWELEVDSVKSVAYRDTAGPGTANVQKMLQHAGRTPELEARNRAIILLAHDRGLRRNEIRMLDLADVDLDRRRVQITGKGRTQTEWLTISADVADAVAKWIELRGAEPGPMFVSLDANHERGRISGQGIYLVAAVAGKRAGAGHVRPHGLRHGGITLAAKAMNGDMVRIAEFARHGNWNTTKRYVDNLQDMGGEVARAVSAARENGETV